MVASPRSSKWHVSPYYAKVKQEDAHAHPQGAESKNVSVELPPKPAKHAQMKKAG